LNTVVFLSDKTYLKYTLNVIKSFKHNNKWFEGDFNIIWLDDILPKNVGNIFFKKPNYDKYKTKYFTLDEICKLKNLYNSNKINYKTVYKLDLFDYNKTYDKVLYLDSDVLVTDSLHELFLSKTSSIFRYVNHFTNAGVIFSTEDKYDFILDKLIDLSKNTMEEVILTKYLKDFKSLDSSYNDTQFTHPNCKIYHMQFEESNDILQIQQEYLNEHNIL